MKKIVLYNSPPQEKERLIKKKQDLIILSIRMKSLYVDIYGQNCV